MRKALVLTALVGSVAAASLAGSPAQAQTVTFALSGSSLAIAEPGTTATLTGGSLASLAGTSITGALGSTTVTDGRGGLIGWTSKVTGTTDFTNGSTTIPVTSATVWIPVAGISTTGVITATQGTYLTQLTGLPLSGVAQTLVTASLVVGNNTATFNPQIAVAIPSNATSGTYTGAVTQTVS